MILTWPLQEFLRFGLSHRVCSKALSLMKQSKRANFQSYRSIVNRRPPPLFFEKNASSHLLLMRYIVVHYVTDEKMSTSCTYHRLVTVRDMGFMDIGNGNLCTRVWAALSASLSLRIRLSSGEAQATVQWKWSQTIESSLCSRLDYP